MNYKALAFDDLKKYESRKAALRNIKEKLDALRESADGLGGRSSDAVPVHGGGNRQEERIIDCMAERETLALNYKVTKRLVDITERGLEKLTQQQRDILLAFASDACKNNSYTADQLAQRMNMDRSTVYRMRNEALRLFTIACYGIVEL